MDDKQQNFYKRLLINIRVKCLKQGIKKSEFCLKQGRKISDICLKQGQGMRGRAAPPHPGIYRVPPPGLDGTKEAYGVARGAAESNSSFLIALQTSQVHP